MLIVKYFHTIHFYAGLNVLDIIRQSYWVIRAQKIIKNYVHKSITCCRYRTASSKQMEDLPLSRVTRKRFFSACGIDYAGPLNILKYQGRGAKTT